MIQNKPHSRFRTQPKNKKKKIKKIKKTAVNILVVLELDIFLTFQPCRDFILFDDSRFFVGSKSDLEHGDSLVGYPIREGTEVPRWNIARFFHRGWTVTRGTIARSRFARFRPAKQSCSDRVVSRVLCPLGDKSSPDNSARSVTLWPRFNELLKQSHELPRKGRGISGSPVLSRDLLSTIGGKKYGEVVNYTREGRGRRSRLR